MDPIIYVHKGTHKYLETSIKQSLKNNKRVILIGDDKNLSIAKKYKIEHYMFDGYNTSNFRKYYKHNKPDTGYEYALIWYERWFVLLEVMKKNNINRCLYIDSDILYYGNIEEEFKRIEKYGDYELAYPNFSGHTAYIFSVKYLDDFCDFMMKCYKDEDMYKKLLAEPIMYQTGLSDMSVFQLYIKLYPEKIFDLKENHGDNIVYDGYINIAEGYKTIFGKKYFKIKNNRAYVYKGKKEIEIKTLHFQMHMKTFMGIVFEKKIRLYNIGLVFTYIAEWLFYKFSFVRYLRRKWKDNSLFK